MQKSKQTKRALLTSVLAMLVCLSMLVGSTFAWFTDSVSTGVNRIVSGTLDVALLDKNGNSLEGQTLDFVKAEGFESETILWEPGCTYNLPEIYIKNNGNLALKYQIIVNGMDGDAPLLEAIEWTITKGGAAVDLATYEGHLAAGEKDTEALVISGHMKEEADNTYQGLEASGISITVLATQDTVEHDSEDNQYDAGAVYPVVDSAKLKSALTAGGNVILGDNLIMDASTIPNIDSSNGRTYITKATTLDLNGKTITFDSGESATNIAALYVRAARANLTINGEGVIDSRAGDSFCINLIGGRLSKPTLTINGGTYLGSTTAVQVEYGTANITGGFFSCTPYNGSYDYTLNCIDSNYKNGYAKIIVTGGTFVNFNPADNGAEGAHTSFVPEGYTVNAVEQANGDIWYTVVPA